jgi:hypothetical protein
MGRLVLRLHHQTRFHRLSLTQRRCIIQLLPPLILLHLPIALLPHPTPCSQFTPFATANLQQLWSLRIQHPPQLIRRRHQTRYRARKMEEVCSRPYRCLNVCRPLAFCLCEVCARHPLSLSHLRRDGLQSAAVKHQRFSAVFGGAIRGRSSRDSASKHFISLSMLHLNAAELRC